MEKLAPCCRRPKIPSAIPGQLGPRKVSAAAGSMARAFRSTPGHCHFRAVPAWGAGRDSLEHGLLQGKSKTMNAGFRLSVAIAVHNEETVLPELLRRTLNVLDGLKGGPHELLIVDDGSTDHTAALVEEAAKKEARIVLLSLSRNFGHQAALTAALDHVTGDATVVMDGDLQDAPEVIPRMAECYLEGYDVVYAQRTGRKETWLLLPCYFLFYRMMALPSGTRIPLDSGDFGLMSRRADDPLCPLP